MVPEQIGPDNGFKGIADADADGNKEGSTIEEVDQKGSQENSRPQTTPKKKKCGKGDA